MITVSRVKGKRTPILRHRCPSRTRSPLDPIPYPTVHGSHSRRLVTLRPRRAQTVDCFKGITNSITHFKPVSQKLCFLLNRMIWSMSGPTAPLLLFAVSDMFCKNVESRPCWIDDEMAAEPVAAPALSTAWGYRCRPCRLCGYSPSSPVITVLHTLHRSRRRRTG
jgi:hypothetical protein